MLILARLGPPIRHFHCRDRVALDITPPGPPNRSEKNEDLEVETGQKSEIGQVDAGELIDKSSIDIQQ